MPRATRAGRPGRISLFVAAVLFIGLGQAAFAQRQFPSSFSELARKVEPAVVSIDTKSRVAQPVAKGTPQPGDSSDVLDFFRQQLPTRPVYAVGSGFIVDKAGYIVTNQHVIEDAQRITVKLDSGEEYTAKVLGTDEETDLAVLKIDAGKELPFVSFGDSDKAEVGEWVVAIGSPFGLSKTVTAGIISQTRRETPYATAFQRFIQTDAVINPGNSGGPLVNMNGEVIGVNSQIATTTGDYNGVGFALPAAEASYVYQQIVKNGKVRRGYLGAFLDSVKTEFAKVYGLPEAKGAIVTEIRDKSGPAAAAGLKVGDIITDFNGSKVESSQDLITRVAATSPDQTVNIVFLRENAAGTLDTRTASTKLGERPTTAGFNSGNPDRRTLQIDNASTTRTFGLTLNELTPALASQYKFVGEKGLLVREINPTSFIADIRNVNGISALSEGDLIQRINRQPVTDLKSFEAIVSKLKVGDPVVLQVLRYNLALQTSQMNIVQFTVK
ncbi:MAG: Do family serine endopeptidase [Acidobacteria bacterium]|nr:Do family serine endopeptidase [Acidobacteriota bacterium]